MGSGGPVQGNANRALILDVLVEQPGDFHYVMSKTGLGKTTVWRWLTDLHECGDIHITSWKRTDGGGPFVATYTAGAGADARCKIKPYSEKQKQRRHQLKAKADGRWEERAARERARYWADRALTHRDPMIAAFFGPARRPATLEAA